ncbi:MAG: DNA mismatch repair endonuclease MutL [Phycisphaerales bacterium]|nr:MAG: DNA mismatch repair endonuclease MutL [Phycisphaerales bacterium]
MGQIAVLDQNMINMIAAGEVIERPASVVKELMENSIDAGATKITVSIEDGGKKLISVTDNGCGMGADDLARAFESHTTSKIRISSDLHGISTLGFRGEALASIASVAQVRAVSQTRESATANCIEIDCGDKGDVAPCSADLGMTIQVRDVFYKLPARRKFLRTTNTEMGHVSEQFTRIALAKQNLDLTLNHNGRELHRLPAEQELCARIARLFPMLSLRTSNDLIQAASTEKGLHILALLGKPAISRTNNRFQYVFLNGRFIRDKFISHAIKEAYRGLLEPNRFPVVFLFIQMPCEDYDVNVHPTKIEVRFYNANLVHSQILGALREKLLGTDLEMPGRLPPTGPPRSTTPRSAPVSSQRIADAMAEFFNKHRPVHRQQQIKFHPASGAVTRDVSADKPTQYDSKFMQIHDSFIVAQTDDGFVIIDQHALHECIMYEDLCRRIRNGNLQSQKLLIPESFEVTPSAAEALENNAELTERIGIELVPFGPRTMAVQAFPTLLSNVQPLDFMQDLMDLLEHTDAGPDAAELLDEVLNMAACKAAIKAGQKLTDGEIEQLLADRQEAESATRCPHGRPTTIKFSIDDLEKQFKRT